MTHKEKQRLYIDALIFLMGNSIYNEIWLDSNSHKLSMNIYNSGQAISEIVSIDPDTAIPVKKRYARTKVSAIIDELKGRSGFDDSFSNIDEDIYLEMFDSLVDIVMIDHTKKI